MSDTDPRCQKCGHPRSNHPYRHMFVGPAKPDTVGTPADLATPLDDPRVEALVEALRNAEAVMTNPDCQPGNSITRAIEKARAALEAIASSSLSALEENK